MPTSESLKRQAKDLLAGVDGVQSIGFSRDGAGKLVLQIDVAPNSDRTRVRQRLDPLDTRIKVREVSGTVRGDITF
jgi:hypothetical protein